MAHGSPTLSIFGAVAAAMVAFVLVRPAIAASPCGPNFSDPVTPDLNALFHTGKGDGGNSFMHVWGRSNMQSIPGPSGSILHVAYPQGSIDPGNDAAPVGGGGFLFQAPGHAEARCLSYRVRFPEDFDFVKGGKLPGLYGGEAPRGCIAEDLSLGFSARLMWRTGGAGELYLYAPDRTARCGDSIGRGSFQLTPGQWTNIAEEVDTNAVGQNNGVICIWVNDKLVIERDDLILREQPQVGVDGLIFATFFGGRDPSWASPRDQYSEFADLTIWTGGADR